MREPRLDLIQELRKHLLTSTASDPWEKFGRWYFMESDVRPISPWSTVSLKEYVDGLIATGGKESLDYALLLSKNLPAWTVKIMALRAKLPSSSPAVAPVKDGD